MSTSTVCHQQSGLILNVISFFFFFNDFLDAKDYVLWQERIRHEVLQDFKHQIKEQFTVQNR